MQRPTLLKNFSTQLVQRYPLCPVYSQRLTPYYPISSGPSTHLVTVNKLVRTSYTDTGPLECTHLKHNLWLLLVIPIEEDTLIFVAHNKWTHTINITLCSQQQYTKYTHLNVLQHYRRKRTQSQSMHLNSWTSHLLPIEKAIYFGIMKNTRAITEGKNCKHAPAGYTAISNSVYYSQPCLDLCCFQWT